MQYSTEPVHKLLPCIGLTHRIDRNSSPGLIPSKGSGSLMPLNFTEVNETLLHRLRLKVALTWKYLHTIGREDSPDCLLCKAVQRQLIICIVFDQGILVGEKTLKQPYYAWMLTLCLNERFLARGLTRRSKIELSNRCLSCQDSWVYVVKFHKLRNFFLWSVNKLCELCSD